MDVTTIEKIAGSQFIWTICSMLLGVTALMYLKSENKEREKKLEESQKEQKRESERRYRELKEESRKREEKLMANLKSLTESQEKSVKAIEGLSQSYTGLKNDYSHLAKRVELIEEKNALEEIPC